METISVPTKKDIKETLNCDTLGRNKSGNYVAKWSYYWGFTKSSAPYEERVRKAYPEATILNSGNHYHSFVGSAKTGSAQDSYMWVEFKF